MPSMEPSPPLDARDAQFDQIAARFAAPLERLARALEDERPGQQALLQDLHVELWRNLPTDDSQPVQVFVHRVALNSVAAHEPNTRDRDPLLASWRDSAARRRLARRRTPL